MTMTYIIQNNEKRPAPKVIDGVSIRPTPAVLLARGLLPYDESNATPPAYDTATHKLSHGGYDEDGKDIWTVTALTPEELEARAEAERQSIEEEIPIAAMKRRLRETVDLEAIAPEHVADLAPIYDQWRPDTAYEADTVLAYGRDTIIRVIQGHTSQSDWTPDITPALYQVLAQPAPGEEYAAWVQPQGAHDAYQTGDRVLHNDQTWESTADNNTWEPGVFGWVIVSE